MNEYSIAIVVHNHQRAFCKSIGDHSLPSWEDAPEAMKQTTYNGVLALLFNPEAGPGFSHDQWMKGKIAEGWVLGDVKDWEKRTHPALVPFEQLPVHEQTKDYLFVETVRNLEKWYWSDRLIDITKR